MTTSEGNKDPLPPRARLSAYNAVVGLLLAATAVAIPVLNTPQWWILPAIFVAAAAAVLLWNPARGVATRAIAMIRARTGITRLELANAELALANTRLADRARESAERARSLYWSGIEEGLRRADAERQNIPSDALPRNLTITVGEGDPPIVGTSPRPLAVPERARATLVVAGTHRLVGVLEVVEVDGEGQVIMRCVDRSWRAYWRGLAMEQVPQVKRLDGMELVRYSRTEHHPQRPADLGEEDNP